MNASVARTIKSILRKHLGMPVFPGLVPGCGRNSLALPEAQAALGQDRGDLRDHFIAGGWDVCVGRHPVLLGRRPWKRRCCGCRVGRKRSSGAVGVRSTPHDGDVAGTHNGLRSYGRCRCLVIRRTLLARLLYRYLPERVKKCHFRWSARHRAVKQGVSTNVVALTSLSSLLRILPFSVFRGPRLTAKFHTAHRRVDERAS